MVFYLENECGCAYLAGSHGKYWACDYWRGEAFCYMIWFIQTMVFYSCNDMIYRSWFDKEVCGIVFIGIGLLAEGMLDVV